LSDSRPSRTFSGGFSGSGTLSAVYAALFVAPGFYLPFFPVFLASLGFTPEAIGIAIGIPMGVRLLANPVAGILSDRFGRPRRFLAVLGLGAAAAFALMAVSPGTGAVLLLVGVATLFWGPAFPLTDAFGVRLSRERGVDYGRARLWGSVAFIAANVALGVALEVLPPSSIVWLIAASLVLYALSVQMLPRLQTPAETDSAAPPKIGARVVLAVFAAACVQSSHAALYAFSSVHWKASGISSSFIGFLWGAGVAAEVVVFYFATVMLKRFSPIGLILIGGASAVVRFALTALDPPQLLLLPLMTMHAFTFTATFLGMVSIAGESGGAGAQGRAQAFSSTAVSIAMLLATFAAGPLYARYGAHVFLVSSLIAAFGCVLALLAWAQPQKVQPQSDGAGGKTVEPS
jgi:PPP family 3-phenylpropionic acid transporter